jgi:hypothetical protein
MNWKLIILGGLAMYVVMFIISMLTGPIIHEGVLKESYIENSQFWRPELNQDPPDMASLMPRWIGMGLLTSFIFAGIYGIINSAFSGAGWMRGLKYGLMLSVMMCCFSAGWSGIFNLPDSLWAWWGAESFLYYLPGGALLGWLGDKFGA